MSQENLELVRRVYEGWARGDFSEGDVFSPDVEFEMPDWPHSAGSRGLEGMRSIWQATLGAWDDFRAEPDRFIETGRHVVVFTHVHAWGKERRGGERRHGDRVDDRGRQGGAPRALLGERDGPRGRGLAAGAGVNQVRAAQEAALALAGPLG
jgi:ketosteroid isomerase-like protein